MELHQFVNNDVLEFAVLVHERFSFGCAQEVVDFFHGGDPLLSPVIRVVVLIHDLLLIQKVTNLVS